MFLVPLASCLVMPRTCSSSHPLPSVGKHVVVPGLKLKELVLVPELFYTHASKRQTSLAISCPIWSESYGIGTLTTNWQPFPVNFLLSLFYKFWSKRSQVGIVPSVPATLLGFESN